MKKKNNVELTFKISNAVTLHRWLSQLPLAGQASRKRSQFISLIEPVVKDVEAKRIELLQSYAEKQDGKTLTFVDEDGVEKFDIKEDNEKKFNEELNGYLKKYYSGVFTDDQVGLLEYIRGIIQNTDFKFSGQMASEYEDWCRAFHID